jgi:hypothetical protein
MESENKYNKYSRYGSRAISFGVLLLVCSLIYFIVLQKRSADQQKKISESVINGLKKIHYLDSVKHTKDSINLSLKNALSKTLNQDNVSKQPGDTHLKDTVAIDAAKAINSYSDERFWVYMGQTVNDSWSPKNFIFSTLPSPGSYVLSAGSVYKRNMLPVQLPDGTWKLGEITGAISTGALLKIDEVQKIEGDNYWALAELNNWIVILGGNKSLQSIQQNFDKFKNVGITTLIIYRQGTYRNISQPLKSQADAATFIIKNKEFLPKDAYIVKLSSWAPKLSFNGTYYTAYGK